MDIKGSVELIVTEHGIQIETKGPRAEDGVVDLPEDEYLKNVILGALLVLASDAVDNELARMVTLNTADPGAGTTYLTDKATASIMRRRQKGQVTLPPEDPTFEDVCTEGMSYDELMSQLNRHSTRH